MIEPLQLIPDDSGEAEYYDWLERIGELDRRAAVAREEAEEYARERARGPRTHTRSAFGGHVVAIPPVPDDLVERHANATTERTRT